MTEIVSFAIGIAVFACAVGLAMLVIRIYNQLVAMRNRCRNAYSQIEVLLKRRHDLIPNLVEACKGYLKHERGTLREVIQARAEATKAVVNVAPGKLKDMLRVGMAETALTASIGKLLAVFEKYPDLKGNENVLRIQAELSNTENAIASSRQSFNDYVTEYNTQIEVFPEMIFAGPMGFESAFLFEAGADREVPGVKF